jgi:TetR/AcrR family transcriptional regulator
MIDAASRRRGRPTSDPGKHRGRLVDSARDLFAAHGYAATSLRQVAFGAGVTPALAHYYFVDKAGLLDAVLRERVAPLVAELQDALGGALHPPGDPAGALARFVQRFTLVASRHPWLPALLMRDASLPDTRALRAQLQALVVAGQSTGAIRADLRADRIVLSVLSLCAFPFMVSGSLRDGADIRESNAATELTLHHLAVLQGGLRATPHSPRQDSTSYPRTSKSRA